MELIQFTGPFRAGQHISVPAQSGRSYIHIGIQVPKRQPIRYWNKALEPEFQINGQLYKINENGILEFDGLAEIAWEIEVKKNLPAEAIIDIALVEQEN